MRRSIALGGLVLLASAVLGATVFRDDVAHAAQVAQALLDPASAHSKDDRVREQNLDANKNIKVHEQGTVGVTQSGSWNVGASQAGTWNVGAAQAGTWNVAATQAGPWAVSITGTPVVTSADQNTVLAHYEGAPAGGGVFTEAVPFANISGARSIRVIANCFESDCVNIQTRVYSIIGGRSYLIEEFPLQNFISQTRVYDVLGTELAVQLINNNPGPVPNVGVAVIGRGN